MTFKDSQLLVPIVNFNELWVSLKLHQKGLHDSLTKLFYLFVSYPGYLFPYNKHSTTGS